MSIEEIARCAGLATNTVKPVNEKTRPWIGLPRLAWALAAGLLLAAIPVSLCLAGGSRPKQFACNQSGTNWQPLPALEAVTTLAQERETPENHIVGYRAPFWQQRNKEKETKTCISIPVNKVGLMGLRGPRPTS